MPATSYAEKLDVLVSQIKDPFLKNIFTVCQKHSKYPKDCIVDGSLEKALRSIIALEANQKEPVDAAVR